MSSILTITFPIYAAIGLGYVLVRHGWFSTGDMRLMGRFVMDVAFPALLFNAVATQDVSALFHPGYMLVYLLGGLGAITLSFLWFSATGIDAKRRAVAVTGSACPNSGFIGYPVMLLTFPDLAGLVLALNMLVENVVLIPICLILMDLAKGGARKSPWRMVGAILLGLLRRPMIIGLMLGLVVSLLQIPVPEPVHRLFSMLAASASALSLIVIGGSLVGLQLTGNRVRALQTAIGKLLMHPALVALAALSLPFLGLPALPADLWAAVVLSAAMPMFGIYPILAQQLDLEGVAAVAMITATTLAFFTLSALLVWLT